MTERERIFGSDLRVAERAPGFDLVRNAAGDLDLAQGDDNIVQALTLRLRVRKGELAPLGWPDYGSRLHELIGEPNNSRTQVILMAHARSAIEQDPRVSQVKEMRAEILSGDREAIRVFMDIALDRHACSVESGFRCESGAAMIDPGHPFVKRYKDLIAALEASIRFGVEQPDRLRETFISSVTGYPLPRIVLDITQVSGTVNNAFVVFRRNFDFNLSSNRLNWLPSADPVNPTRRPDDGTKFDVEFTYRERPSGLTDFNEGSVVGTLLRAVARELTLAYDEMDEAYRRGFLDQATGVALDNVTALLGVTRNPARKAAGRVTFLRKKPADQDVVIKKATRVADAAGKSFVTTQDAVIAVGATSVAVPVEAVDAGPQGNVNSGTIVIMPTPPRGVDGVTNERPTIGGKEAEPDDQLRERARHALETAGNATLNAIRFAILDVDGVDDVEVVDHETDKSIPLGEVRVLFSGLQTDEVRDNVQKAVDRTRAAGVLVKARMIDTVFVSGTLFVIPSPTAPATASSDFKGKVIAAVNALGIGEALSVRRLNALVYEVNGLAEVAEAQLVSSKRTPDNPAGVVTDPYLIEQTELLRPDTAALNVALLVALRGTNATASGLPHDIDIQVLGAAAQEIGFVDFSLDISVALTARSLTAPDQPPRQIGGLQRRIEFHNQPTFRLTLTKEHITIPDALLADMDLTQVNVIIRAAAFAGLRAVEDLKVDLST